MRKTDAEYTKKYQDKRGTKRYVIDLYPDDPTELEIIDLFDAAKANKQFKALIIKALQDYKNKAPN